MFAVLEWVSSISQFGIRLPLARTNSYSRTCDFFTKQVDLCSLGLRSASSAGVAQLRFRIFCTVRLAGTRQLSRKRSRAFSTHDSGLMPSFFARIEDVPEEQPAAPRRSLQL